LCQTKGFFECRLRSRGPSSVLIHSPLVSPYDRTVTLVGNTTGSQQCNCSREDLFGFIEPAVETELLRKVSKSQQQVCIRPSFRHTCLDCASVILFSQVIAAGIELSSAKA